MYLDHLKFCGVCINGRRYICCSECYVLCDECDDPPLSCVTYRCIRWWSYVICEFLLCGWVWFSDDICMCVVNKQFGLLEFVFNSVYVDLKYNEICLTFTAGSVCLCGVVMLSSLVCLWGCLGTLLCGRCGGYGDCDLCAIVCVGCEYAERVRGWRQCWCGRWREVWLWWVRGLSMGWHTWFR